ncbi:hypothetical protein B0A54_05494 [Friedmanniomyces endolithicus]|uniref:Tubulin-specific chaperone A n=1 Tax=Friedmanniomyces endolithicus TaxID=329885 RepID=A0A4U0V7C7_9PEZI|nr:hypothetical protein B0A54_05494 [Friedmanniomyces endolithicus]
MLRLHLVYMDLDNNLCKVIESEVVKRKNPIPAELGSAKTFNSANDKIEEITELYATAQDEFEIAMEETEKMSVYAEEDRKAAREELGKVQEAYRKAVEGEDGAVAEEVRRRVGQRIRELEQGVLGMEELAQNQD